MIAILSKSFSIKKLLVDSALLAVVYFIPALSHLCPVPLYLLDPMRLVLLTGLLLTRNNVNACFLALTIPVFSSLIVGHPPMVKAILISIELTVNVLLFIQFLTKPKWYVPIALFVSILLSKMVYYSVKFTMIKTGILDGVLFSTPLYIQMGVVLLITLVFSAIWMKKT
ncbi:MAG: hypothetical protein PHP04_14355 [Bacteroidales bacterium]|nr:hypothetical protein [Bacteroidales bacterium]